MSEEEIIKIIKYMLENKNTDINVIINYEAIQGLLDLYTKQQNEIKHQRQQRKYWRDIFYEQQKEIKELTLDLEEMTKSNNHKLENWVHKNILNSYISKDKIREKIEELKEIADEDNPDIYIKIDAYQELLEEN